MAIKSILKPDGSILMGVATAALVAVIFRTQLPEGAVIHATDPANDINVDAGRKKATLSSIGVLSAITLLTRDVNVFILGGVVTVALDFNARHANASHPVTGQLVSGNAEPSQLRVVS
jgi:hypothetical protein